MADFLCKLAFFNPNKKKLGRQRETEEEEA